MTSVWHFLAAVAVVGVMTHRRLLLRGCVPLFAPAAAPVAVVVPDGIGVAVGLDFGTRLSPLTFFPPGEPRSDCAVARAAVSPMKPI